MENLSSIIRCIRQTYVSDDLPADLPQMANTWKKLNPRWDYSFMDDQTISDYVQKAGTEFHAMFKAFPLSVMRADFWRYLVLFNEGGMYADIDTVCQTPLDNMVFDSDGMIVALENNIHFCQWAFYSVPGHPVLKRTLELIAHRWASRNEPFHEHFVHDITGPAVFSQAIIDTLGVNLQLPLDGQTYNTPFADIVEKLVIGNPSVKATAEKIGLRIGSWENNIFHSYYGGANVDQYTSWTRERDALLRNQLE